MVSKQFIAQNRPAGKPAPDMSVTLSGLKLDNPVVPASGTFGYGNEFRDFYDINILGSFVQGHHARTALRQSHAPHRRM